MQHEKLADLRTFLAMVWRHNGLPSPSKGQYEIADIIQNVLKYHGVVPLPPREGFLEEYPFLKNDDGTCTDRIMLGAYRGEGKSVKCSTITDWIHYWAPTRCVMAVSGTDNKAKEFTNFALKLIREIPVLQHLYPRSQGLRSSSVAYDVEGATEQAPSTRAASITGTITGGRADVAFVDDMETPNNSKSLTTREDLKARSSEIGGAILKPNGVVIVLFTPQCEETVYNVLERERGYTKMIFPARYPSDQWMENHGAYLLPRLRKEMEEKGPACQTGGGLDGTLGQPTDPERFGEEELCKREAEWGRTGFMMHYMLDTALSDALRYPLKISDLICMELDKETAPQRIYKGKHPDRIWKELPVPPMKGARFYHPMEVSDERSKYSGCVMFIDPAGRGADELAYAVVKHLNGFLYLTRSGGLVGGYGTDNLAQLANIAKDESVNEIVTEPNFGDGMFDQLLAPVLRDIYPCRIQEGPRAVAQKEMRIIDSLEPVMNQGLLVVDPKVVEDDVKAHPGESPETTQRRSLFYQMAFITRERGSLHHDDRIDALAGAVSYWQAALGVDIERKLHHDRIKAIREMHREYYSSPRSARNKRHTSFLEGI